MIENLYRVAITAVVIKDGKFLITRRSANKKRWPLKWTVPGGNLEPADYATLPKDTVDAWYNALENTLTREVMEEVGLSIKNVRYLTSIIAEYPDGHALIISCLADYDSGEVKLQESETDQYAWVTAEEAKKYELIDGIRDELVLAEKYLKGDKSGWSRQN
ncbi:MAG: NUDIX domain-containing protein [Patescibacteria group bacterium]